MTVLRDFIGFKKQRKNCGARVKVVMLDLSRKADHDKKEKLLKPENLCKLPIWEQNDMNSQIVNGDESYSVPRRI